MLPRVDIILWKGHRNRLGKMAAVLCLTHCEPLISTVTGQGTSLNRLGVSLWDDATLANSATAANNVTVTNDSTLADKATVVNS